ncbi:hypothetical protein RBS60_14150 [Sinomonas sp. ASV486]|uniref:DUF5668 domain-containing protein n=1 Tax=Sinomonas puerhi TaxID=3238584 RepID=A0AB39L3W8_9MICC|nr:hypothetical protein [Sinomonas sp. ASV486]MDQ4491340.1 hypothetical protein [Sinomonas sp. ASV486]
MKLFGWGLVMLAIFILGMLVNIGDGIYMFLWAAIVLIAVGGMKLARPAG